MVNEKTTGNLDNFMTATELAGILGVSRTAIHKRIKKGEIPTRKIGKFYFISKSFLSGVTERTVNSDDKRIIESAVKRTVREYGEALRLLGKE